MKWLVGWAEMGAITGMLAAGCGGDDSTPVGPEDSGTDHTTLPEAAVDAAAETSNGDARLDVTCVPNVDIARLPIPDVAIGDTGLSLPGCITCVKTSCPSEFAACAASCDCVVAIQEYLTCVTTGGDPALCGGALGAGPSARGNDLGMCVGGPLAGADSSPGCLVECGLVSGTVGGGSDEGGPTDGGLDGRSDEGPTDGGVDGGAGEPERHGPSDD
jgi:hypothetical protein